MSCLVIQYGNNTAVTIFYVAYVNSFHHKVTKHLSNGESYLSYLDGSSELQ